MVLPSRLMLAVPPKAVPADYRARAVRSKRVVADRLRSWSRAPMLGAMKRLLLIVSFALGCSKSPAAIESPPMTTSADVLNTAQGRVEIVPIHHATLLLRWNGKAIFLDPVQDGNYDALPKATHVLLTDIHPDHLDAAAIDRVRTSATVLIGPQVVADKIPGVTVMRNGETRSVDGFTVEAVPMYNLQRGPAPGKLYHDKGRGNGYVLTFGDKRVYVSGDTECTPEMQALKNIDVAFLCMNLPYTMPPLEAAECVKAFRPAVVYPYHFRGSDPNEVKAALLAYPSIEVRIRTWY